MISFKPIFFLAVINIVSLTVATGSSNNPFERLTKKAEEQYKQSKDDGNLKHDNHNESKKNLSPISEEQKIKILEQQRATFKPHLGGFKKFSDEWWNTLFKCEPCKFGLFKKQNLNTDRDNSINCEKLLSKNPQWREVEEMSQDAKQVIMKRALDKIDDKEAGACNVACAVCVGADPNTRNSDFHTALHLVSEDFFFPHYGLFELLLKKGASPNLKCQPCHPLEFGEVKKNKKWEDKLKKYGAGDSQNYGQNNV